MPQTAADYMDQSIPPEVRKELLQRHLGYRMSGGIGSLMEAQPSQPLAEVPESAVAAIIRKRLAAGPPAAPQAAAPEPVAPLPLPPPTPVTKEAPPAADEGSDWWKYALGGLAGFLLRGKGKKLARGAEGAAHAAAPSAKAAAVPTHATGHASGGGTKPPKPIPLGTTRPQKQKALPAPQKQMLALPAPSAANRPPIPPPTLTQTDLPTLPDVLMQRARQNQRGVVSTRPGPRPPSPAPPTVPGPAMDMPTDLSPDQIKQVLTLTEQLADNRAAALAARAPQPITSALNKKGNWRKKGQRTVQVPPAPPKTPQYASTKAFMDQGEPDIDAFNTAVAAVRSTNPAQAPAPVDMKPWLKEPLPPGAGGQPYLPEVADVLSKRQPRHAARNAAKKPSKSGPKKPAKKKATK